MKYPIQKQNKFKKSKKLREHFRKKKPNNPKIAVPSFFTLMNLFCGFLSVITVSKGNLEFGAWLIALAGLFDVLDGLMARLTDSTSEFGIELDSISDIVSFGVAPGFLIYSYSLNQLDFFGIIVSALPPLCGAVRLARFNVNAKYSEEKDEYSGLPIPAQAIILATFYLAFNGSTEIFEEFKHGVNAVLIPTIITISFLMVSAVPFDKIPRFDRNSLRRNKGKFVLFMLYLVLILIFQEYGLTAVFAIYLGKALFVGAVRFWQQVFVEESEDYDILDRYTNR